MLQGMNGPLPIQKRYGANLPHWTREGGIYAVTFRLGDSLPAGVLEQYVSEREEIVRRANAMQRPLAVYELGRLRELHSDRIEQFLDQGQGECIFRSHQCARIARDAIVHFDGERYVLFAWCIMPNHVHAVLRPRCEHSLSSVLHSWKSFSSKAIGKLLNREGTLWQEESYDHLVRDVQDFAHAVRYVVENPLNAGLRNWPWVGGNVAELLLQNADVNWPELWWAQNAKGAPKKE